MRTDRLKLAIDGGKTFEFSEFTIESCWFTDTELTYRFVGKGRLVYYDSRGYIPRIKKTIFNDPATIVFWDDNTKTVVRRGEHDIFDPEKGLAMAIAKKALGNEGNYYEVIKKHLTGLQG